MQCLYPIWINLKYPRIDTSTGEYISRCQVPCGRCEACLERKRLDWFVRLKIESEHCVCSYFLTLTYSDYYLPVSYDDAGNEILHFDKQQVQLFLKRLRSRLSDIRIRYFLISEYGSNTFRSHYHVHFFLSSYISQEDFHIAVQSSWPFGHVYSEVSVDGNLNYVCGHVQFVNDTPPGYDRPFTLQSRCPGIGSQLLDNYIKISKQSDVCYLYTDSEGKKYNLPRYYRDRIYTRLSKDNRCNYLDSLPKPTINEQNEFARKIRKRKKQRRAKGL